MPRLIMLRCAISMLTVLSAIALAGCGEKPQIGRLTILISGNIQGYLRNCGCSAGQAGGELRKARILKMEQQEALKPKPTDRRLEPGVVLLDIGNFSNAQSKVTRAESAGVIKSMSKLGYDAVGVGSYELEYSQADLLTLLKLAPLPLTAANLRFIKPQQGEDHSAELNGMLKPYQVKTLKNGYAIGLIHVVDLSVANRFGQRTGFELKAPAAAVEEILKAHGGEAQFWILSVADPRNNSADRDQLAALPGIDVLVGYPRQTSQENERQQAGDTAFLVIAPFQRAKDIVRATIGFTPEGKVETALAEEVMIPETVTPDEYVQTLVDEIQPELERLANEDADVQDLPGVHPRYVGTTACASCHQQVVDRLSESKHGHAYETLKEKDQHRSAACLPCHVTGYNKAGGWNILKNAEREEMRGIHCESCHGPGEYHVALKTGSPAPADLTANGRNAAGLLTASERTCLVCHDEPNSPQFSFEKYWPQIEHGKEQNSKPKP